VGHRQIRVGQLIAPFGPGSIYTDRKGTPHIVCGLDHWYERSDPIAGSVPCGQIEEFAIFEPRLAELLLVDSLRAPPDYRAVRKGTTAPPNARLETPALRFPRWHRDSKSGKLKRFNLSSQRLERTSGGGRWLPVRFVATCCAGHLSDFPWKAWIGCECDGDGNLHLTDRGGSELSSIRVECRSCPSDSVGRKGKTLSGTTTRPVETDELSAFEAEGITCLGERPWLGEGADEPCSDQLVGALINQTNLYLPKTLSAILLPDLALEDDELLGIRASVESLASELGMAKMLWDMSSRHSAATLIQSLLKEKLQIQADIQKVERVLESLFKGGSVTTGDAKVPSSSESRLLAFRRAEFNIIRRKVDDPGHIPDLRVIPTVVAPALKSWFSRVNLVERLRETRVFYGFDRLGIRTNPLEGMPESAMHQLFRKPPVEPHERWLPAIKVYGEGLYIELDETAISKWQGENAEWLSDRLSEAFILRLQDQFQTLPPLAPVNWQWASRYMLVHTLSHVLISQLVFECGYSSASLRERLYVSVDSDAPMAGFLIYTAAGDAEGTLGGLVRLGHKERLAAVVQRALSRAAWCSADPICSENLGGQGSRLANLAACHSCALLPETSCETVNHGLDRAMIVGTPIDRGRGALASLLGSVFSLY
jgi:hypothetical protein